MAVIRFDWGMCVRGCQRLLVREKSTQWGPLDMVLEVLEAGSPELLVCCIQTS